MADVVDVDHDHDQSVVDARSRAGHEAAEEPGRLLEDRQALAMSMVGRFMQVLPSWAGARPRVSPAPGGLPTAGGGLKLKDCKERGPGAIGPPP